MLIHLARNRHKLLDRGFWLRYGFLYDGYDQRRTFWWEAVVFGRKILTVTMAVIVQNAFLQFYLVSFAVLVALTAHLVVKPYSDPVLNHVETVALTNIQLVLLFTVLGVGTQRQRFMGLLSLLAILITLLMFALAIFPVCLRSSGMVVMRFACRSKHKRIRERWAQHPPPDGIGMLYAFLRRHACYRRKSTVEDWDEHRRGAKDPAKDTETGSSDAMSRRRSRAHTLNTLLGSTNGRGSGSDAKDVKQLTSHRSNPMLSLHSQLHRGAA
ncbi:unnamed protein product, partial [Symbiodinium sp. KB8]